MKSYIRNRTFILFISFLFAQGIYGQQLYYPDTSWQTKKPSELKMNTALIDSAISFAIRNEIKVLFLIKMGNLY